MWDDVIRHNSAFIWYFDENLLNTRAYLTRALEREVRFCHSLTFLCENLSTYSFYRRDFFSTCLYMNGARFSAKK